jgi:glucan phosphoethanolaminetransferase (alkaline phosphatase superfamily)
LSLKNDARSGGDQLNFSTLIMKPSGFIPVALSLAALALVVGHIAVFGVVREADEGTAAHIFQLLMVAEIPFIVFFAGNWLPRSPKPALQVLTLQAIAGLAALAPVFIFKL